MLNTDLNMCIVFKLHNEFVVCLYPPCNIYAIVFDAHSTHSIAITTTKKSIYNGFYCVIKIEPKFSEKKRD